MTRRERKRVMVVVPSLAPREQRNPPTVRGFVVGSECLIPEAVRCAVHEPGDVVHHHETDEYAPDHHRKAADGEKTETERNLKPDLIAIEEDIIWMLDEVGRVPELFFTRGPRFVRLVEPLEMRPEKAAMRV